MIRSVRGGGGGGKSHGVGSANIYGASASFMNPYARNENIGFKIPHNVEKTMNVRVA